uniref:Uncharacterized protein n=1 Tax=Takifugu rubripes TaxID=31033 RepID=A0A674MZ37_TAKRU
PAVISVIPVSKKRATGYRALFGLSLVSLNRPTRTEALSLWTGGSTTLQINEVALCCRHKHSSPPVMYKYPRSH